MVISRGKRGIGKSRAAEEEDDGGGGGGDQIACTGKACKLCTAGAIADCVAVCCCPCAVVNILVLALFKVPWMLGRKCLGFPRRKRRSIGGGGGRRICNERCCSYRSGGISRIGGGSSGEDGALGIESAVIGNGEQQQIGKDNFSSRFDEDIWLELHQVGHLGFGRISFTGAIREED